MSLVLRFFIVAIVVLLAVVAAATAGVFRRGQCRSSRWLHRTFSLDIEGFDGDGPTDVELSRVASEATPWIYSGPIVAHRGLPVAIYGKTGRELNALRLTPDASGLRLIEDTSPVGFSIASPHRYNGERAEWTGKPVAYEGPLSGAEINRLPLAPYVGDARFEGWLKPMVSGGCAGADAERPGVSEEEVLMGIAHTSNEAPADEAERLAGLSELEREAVQAAADSRAGQAQIAGSLAVGDITRGTVRTPASTAAAVAVRDGMRARNAPQRPPPVATAAPAGTTLDELETYQRPPADLVRSNASSAWRFNSTDHRFDQMDANVSNLNPSRSSGYAAVNNVLHTGSRRNDRMEFSHGQPGGTWGNTLY